MKLTLVTVLSTVVVLGFAVSASAVPPSDDAYRDHARAIRVDCNKGGSISATLAHLAQTGNTRGITIMVKGTCTENITISGFDHLVLKSFAQGATLQDASNGSNPVVNVSSSYDVTLEGFTINGGFGVGCGNGSLCRLNSNTIQQSVGVGVGAVGSDLYLTDNNILNNAAFGVDAESGSNVFTSSNTISGNFRGFLVFAGSNLTASGDTVQQNNESGIVVVNKSFMRAINLTINNNKGDGVFIVSGSTAAFHGGDTITGNGINGVSVGDLSYAEFATFAGANTVTGNLTAPDVYCGGKFPVVEGAATVGGTTNCQ